MQTIRCGKGEINKHFGNSLYGPFLSLDKKILGKKMRKKKTLIPKVPQNLFVKNNPTETSFEIY